MDMKSVKKPAAEKYPPIPQFLNQPIESPPHSVEADDTSAFTTGFLVLGFGIFCWMVYKVAELVIAPCAG
jgi:hypothetical protein